LNSILISSVMTVAAAWRQCQKQSHHEQSRASPCSQRHNSISPSVC